MLNNYLELFVCPDCRENLKTLVFQKKLYCFFCSKCKIIFPVYDDIPIILHKEARNYELEYPLVKKCDLQVPRPFSNIHTYIKNTLDLLILKRGILTWEWEDEYFWSRKYSKEMEIGTKKNWNDRIWQREFIIKELTNRFNLEGKTILSVGCGEGQNFKFLLKKYCDENSLYIAIDISLEALKLNRSRNMHKNSLYILCSADYELPFPNNVVDVICYFGILHHTKNKSSNIKKDKRLLRRNGYIILTESVDRPILRLSLLIHKAETSAHEEHISKKYLFTQLEKTGIEAVFIREEGTPFFTAAMTIFRDAMLNNQKLFLSIYNLDSLIIKTIGRIIPFFKAGEIQLLARRSIDKSARYSRAQS